MANLRTTDVPCRHIRFSLCRKIALPRRLRLQLSFTKLKVLTARLLVSESSNFKQALERAYLYESRIKKSIDQGDLQMAVEPCQNAMGYVLRFHYGSLGRVFRFAANKEFYYSFFRKLTDLKLIFAC